MFNMYVQLLNFKALKSLILKKTPSMISINLSNAVCTVSKIQFHYVMHSTIKIWSMFKITLTKVILSIRPTENRMLIYNNL